MLSLDDLRTDRIARLKLRDLSRLAGESPVTTSRAVKSGELPAIRKGNRIFILAHDAKKYLFADGHYKHNHQDAAALSRMEIARAAKKTK